MKPLFQSKTTQNVAIGTAGGIAVPYIIISTIRSFNPQLLPWSEGDDQAISNFLTLILTPLISRFVAIWRKKDTAQ